MLRDLKFLRRNSSRTGNVEEAENMPPKSGNFVLNQTSAEPQRPPLNAIQEPFRTPKCISDPDTGGSRPIKHGKTPVKQKPGAQLHLRTPEKQGALSKDRYNSARKFDCSVLETKDDVKTATSVSTPGSFRVFRRCNSSNSDCTSTQSTPTKSVKEASSGCNVAIVSRPPLSVGSRLPNYAAMTSGYLGPGNFFNTVEVPYFELKEDSSFWMEQNVQVLIRIRPLNSMEKSTVGFNRCLKQESSQSVTWIGQPQTRFHFDHVACEAIDQETLFRMVGMPMVENCLSGYNSCMFAYGQTGSGKTHTMLGEIDGIEVKPSLNRGMMPRIFEFLFARIKAEEETRRDERLKYNCKCSFLEIYNEQISDLLDPSSTSLSLREDMTKGVYVEDLSEFEVRNVGDILQLLTLGSSNRRVAATSMNKESSRSHSVFTCVIESRWEKDSIANYRFARLNLVDLAGSERQKSSGAEGERLKEAASINKSLSTLGHVIMVLVDVANGKPRHVPYRDSRLTFLLQDSLGGNSKTVIIANVSPSVCSAAETLNTLKFAQRAKLIQNNAIINEDSSGDVNSLKIQIQLLKDELSALKHEKQAQPLSYEAHIENKNDDDSSEKESKGVLRISFKQLKSLETTLSSSLRREQMAEISAKQQEAEIERLNRLISQREEDSRCAKMMLKFREDKIQRLEFLNEGLLSADDYLMRENCALSEEIQLLRSRIDKNPEVTHFALETMKLLEKVQQIPEFCDEGKREMLMTEISKLRNQVIFFLGRNSRNQNYSKVCEFGEDENDSPHMELKKTLSELEETHIKLNCCQEETAILQRKIEEMCESSKRRTPIRQEHACNTDFIKDSIIDVTRLDNTATSSFAKGRDGPIHGNLSDSGEDIMNLQLELDILKIILQEERSARSSLEETLKSISQELQMSNKKVHSSMEECSEVQEELKNMKLVVKALEGQQIEHINEIENLKNSNKHYQRLLKEKEIEIHSLMDQVLDDEMRNLSTRRSSERENSVIETKLKKMHESLEKEKKLNVYFQNGMLHEYDVEMEEAQKQVEAETSRVIVSLREELSNLQKEIENSKVRETESRENLELLKNDSEILKGHLYSRNQENDNLASMLEEKEKQLSELMEECSLFVSEVESNLYTGNEALQEVHEQVDAICGSFPHNEKFFIQKFGRIKSSILEKELLIEELGKCLKEAVERRDDMDFMFRSLRGAVMAIIEAHQQECSQKDKEILLLTTELNNKTSTILDFLNSKNSGEYHLEMMSSSCAKADNEEIVVQTQETIKELASGLFFLMSCIGQFLMEHCGDPGEDKVEKCKTSLEDDLSQARAHAEESMLLRNGFNVVETRRVDNLGHLNMQCFKGSGLAKNIYEVSSKILNSFSAVDDMFAKVHNEIDTAAVFMEQLEYLENLARQFDSKLLSLETNASRKDDVLKGLLFDLCLLQESASNFKDQKDEMEKLQTSLIAMEEGFESKSLELDQAVARAQMLENQLQEKKAEISGLELHRANPCEMKSSLTFRNTGLLASVNEALDGKDFAYKELMKARVKIEKLEMAVSDMETLIAQMSRSIVSLQNELDTIIGQRNELDGKLCALTREPELARAIAVDKEAITLEAQEIEVFQKSHAEEKETEAKLLEISIEELESNINVLERKVGIIKEEAEQQRLQREELELELLGIKKQMRNAESNDLDKKRCLDEKEKTLQHALQRLQLLEKEIIARDIEISKCKSHISELNLHAEAQANEYRQKFKALKIMVEELKSEDRSPQIAQLHHQTN